MDANRAQWAVRRRLDRLSIDIGLPAHGLVVVTAAGRCDSKRAALWTHQETCPRVVDVLGVADRVAVLVQACMTHRPIDGNHLDKALRSSASWEDVELPW